MGASIAGFATVAATALVTTAETVVGTLVIPPINEPGGQGIEIDANVTLTTGAATTRLQVRVRQDTLAGAVVGNVIENAATASATNSVSGCVLDPVTSYPNGKTYVVTAQQVSATGNGAMQYAAVFANPLTGAS